MVSGTLDASLQLLPAVLVQTHDTMLSAGGQEKPPSA